jgi:2-dehydro-3-deoxygalactonokinase
MSSRAGTALVGVDWGSTSCRAFRYDRDGNVCETRHGSSGIGSLDRGAFAGAFDRLVGDWLTHDESIPVLLCGMIGSKQGWVDVPYMTVPTEVQAVVANLKPLTALARRAAIVPGLKTRSRDALGFDDVMRGEETQVFGCVKSSLSEWVVAPGTHSKWILASDGRIEQFDTYMTGELFALLRERSLLATVMTEAIWSPEAFKLGVQVARQQPDWLHQLFGVRTRGLFGDVAPSSLPDFLSGLLIGYEVASAPRDELLHSPVRLIATAQLAQRYCTALGEFSVQVQLVDGEAAVSRGLWSLATAAGWLE